MSFSIPIQFTSEDDKTIVISTPNSSSVGHIPNSTNEQKTVPIVMQVGSEGTPVQVKSASGVGQVILSTISPSQTVVPKAEVEKKNVARSLDQLFSVSQTSENAVNQIILQPAKVSEATRNNSANQFVTSLTAAGLPTVQNPTTKTFSVTIPNNSGLSQGEIQQQIIDVLANCIPIDKKKSVTVPASNVYNIVKQDVSANEVESNAKTSNSTSSESEIVYKVIKTPTGELNVVPVDKGTNDVPKMQTLQAAATPLVKQPSDTGSDNNSGSNDELEANMRYLF